VGHLLISGRRSEETANKKKGEKSHVTPESVEEKKGAEKKNRREHAVTD